VLPASIRSAVEIVFEMAKIGGNEVCGHLATRRGGTAAAGENGSDHERLIGMAHRHGFAQNCASAHIARDVIAAKVCSGWRLRLLLGKTRASTIPVSSAGVVSKLLARAFGSHDRQCD
jgi:hypothetical protein